MGPRFNGVTLAFNTRTRDEVDAVLAEAQKAGAKLEKPAQEAFWAAIQDTFPVHRDFCATGLGSMLFRSPKMEACNSRIESAQIGCSISKNGSKGSDDVG